MYYLMSDTQHNDCGCLMSHFYCCVGVNFVSGVENAAQVLSFCKTVLWLLRLRNRLLAFQPSFCRLFKHFGAAWYPEFAPSLSSPFKNWPLKSSKSSKLTARVRALKSSWCRVRNRLPSNRCQELLFSSSPTPEQNKLACSSVAIIFQISLLFSS